MVDRTTPVALAVPGWAEPIIDAFAAAFPERIANLTTAKTDGLIGLEDPLARHHIALLEHYLQAAHIPYDKHWRSAYAGDESGHAWYRRDREGRWRLETRTAGADQRELLELLHCRNHRQPGSLEACLYRLGRHHIDPGPLSETRTEHPALIEQALEELRLIAQPDRALAG